MLTYTEKELVISLLLAEIDKCKSEIIPDIPEQQEFWGVMIDAYETIIDKLDSK